MTSARPSPAHVAMPAPTLRPRRVPGGPEKGLGAALGRGANTLQAVGPDVPKTWPRSILCQACSDSENGRFVDVLVVQFYTCIILVQKYTHPPNL